MSDWIRNSGPYIPCPPYLTCPYCGSEQVRVVLSKVKPAFMICLNCHFSDSKMEEGQLEDWSCAVPN